MDERRTGEDGYRRRLADVREQVPTHPGRPIEPFGYTVNDAKVLVDGGAKLHGSRTQIKHREALGPGVRRFTNTEGRTSKQPSRESVPRWMYLRNAAERISSEDLDMLVDALRAEQRRRRRLLGSPESQA